VVLLPTAVGIGLLIANQVEHQRRDRERINQIERWRAALTATLAHDLRSPLTTVQLVLESVRAEVDDGDEPPAAERGALLDTALRQLGRVSRLSAGLLDAERVDSRGDLRLDLAEVSVRRAVDEVVAQLDSADVRAEVDPDLVLTADPERFEQMLINLTANALRHGSPPVVISGGAIAEGARIEVRDHGPGVPPGEREHLFAPFHGANRADSTGLGLWIVDRLARAHGGEVRYEPADPGARLVLILPRRPPRAGDPRS
jgi:signal transduction histidine kinase